jgi:FkbM family methyltransferase
MARIKKLISEFFLALGFSIRSTSSLNQTEVLARSGTLIELLASSTATNDLTLGESLGIVTKAKSQLGQDVLALAQVGIKQPGFFVEFGATNGLDLSNTYLLEKNFGWKGILCEPAKEWHEELRLNRSCAIDTRCVYSSTGQNIQFSETSIGELSTISSYMKSDANRLIRKKSATYEVETVTLEDLLSTHNAPSYIDFLSIDTEGSEYEILNAFDFSRYSFGLICVEHNFTNNREKIRELLTANGYSQVLNEYSAFDDWYVGAKR